MVDENEDREVSESEIDRDLEEIIAYEGIFDNPSKAIKSLAKLIYNLRFDHRQLIIKLKNVLSLPMEEYNEEYVPKPEMMINDVRDLYS